MMTLTENAVNAVAKFIEDAERPVSGLRVMVKGGGCSGMQYSLQLEEAATAEDTVVDCGQVKVFVDPDSAPMLEGVTMDFIDSMEKSGFKFENPNATASCGCGNSFCA